LNAAQAGLVLGYNNDDLVNARMGTELYDRFVTHKVDASTLPPHDLADLVREMVMPNAPEGMVQVHLGGGSTGAEANELAISAALTKFAKAKGTSVSGLSVLGFDNSNHGQTTATLSCSGPDANPEGLPAFPWPKGDYPQLKYPLAKFQHENIAEEDRCLEGVKKSIAGGNVGAMIVEPISSIGNQMATPYFYRELQKIAKAGGIPFIVDETKTGMGASGKNWAHEYWYLKEAPDYMTFGGKAGISGFYSTYDFRMNDEATSFSQNINMIKLLNYGTIWNVLKKGDILGLDLLHHQKATSSFLKIELDRVGAEKGLISNVRGYGTHLGFDFANEKTAQSVQRWLFKSGVHALLCGPKTLALRPSMTLGVKEGAVLRDSLYHFHPNHE